MNTRLDRLIKRARAPLSALQPVVPSALAPESPLHEDVQERLSGQPIFPGHRAVEGAGDALPSVRPAEAGPVISSRQSVLSREQKSEGLPVPRVPESLLPPHGVSTLENRSSRAQQDAALPYDRSAVPEAAAEAQTRDRAASDDPRPVAGTGSQADPQRAPKPEPRQSDLAQILREVAARSVSAKQAQLSPAPGAEPAESLIEVNVSIGSIDFRAARQAEPVKRAESHPRVTLDSYLQRGKRDGR